MDENLQIDLINNHDEKACRDFIGLHKDMVFRVCFSFVNNRQDAEELTQDVFISAINSISSFKKEAQLHTWLYRIAINQSLNFIRKQNNKSFIERLRLTPSVEKEMVDQNNLSDGNSPETMRITEENNQMLYRSIEALKKDQRIAFTLHKIDEFSYAEVAEIMKISVSAVESLIHRAKKKLQEQLIKRLR